MKKTILVFTFIFFAVTAFSQFTYKIKADSVLITNDSCSAELNLENSSKNINGFLYNTGNGRTEFRRGLIRDQIDSNKYFIGGDTLMIASGGTPAGSDTYIQYSAGNIFAADSGFRWKQTGHLAYAKKYHGLRLAPTLTTVATNDTLITLTIQTNANPIHTGAKIYDMKINKGYLRLDSLYNFSIGSGGTGAPTAGYSNFIGVNAGRNDSGANKSNFIGLNAGDGAINAHQSNFIGEQAGSGAAEASNSNFLGQNAGRSATNASNSNFINFSAGHNATNASNSSFFGYMAGYGATGANNSNFSGAHAGNGSTGAYNSNFFGPHSGHNAINANYSNFIGVDAGRNATTANNSNFFGAFAGNNSTGASSSNFIGNNTGNGATNASNSNFMGTQTGYGATGATGSNFFGYKAGHKATGAYNSNFIGNQAGNGAITATYSNFLGYHVGDSLTHKITGNNNILIGTNITTPTATSGNMFSIGNVLYGTNTYSTSSGNPSAVAQTNGQVGINITTPNASAVLDVTSTTKGLLFPRMTTTQKNAISTPATGLQVYDSTLNSPQYYNGTAWVSAGGVTTENDPQFDTKFAAKTTDSLVEGAVNKYFSNTLARSSISLTTTGSGAATYNSGTGVINVPTPATTIASLQQVTDNGNATTNALRIVTSGNVEAASLYRNGTNSQGELLLEDAALLGTTTTYKMDSILYRDSILRFPHKSGTLALLSDIAAAGGTSDLQQVTNLGNTTTTNINAASFIGTADATINGITIGKGPKNTTGKSIAIGKDALKNNTTGNNIAIGYEALFKNSTAGYNTESMGAFAPSIAIGYQALYSSGDSTVSQTGAGTNIAIGNKALYTINYTGVSGTNAACYNIALGNNTLQYQINGIQNVAIGYFAGQDITYGSDNIYVGGSAGRRNTTGNFNTAMGRGASYTNTTGHRNVNIGDSAGYYNNGGSNNTFLGFRSGMWSETASDQIFLNSLNRLTYTGDQTGSPFYAQQNSTVANQTVTLNGNVGINNITPDASAALDVTSTTKGFLPPRMTTAQRNAITSPATGITLYCIDCTATDASTGVMQTYNGSTWKNYW